MFLDKLENVVKLDIKFEPKLIKLNNGRVDKLNAVEVYKWKNRRPSITHLYALSIFSLVETKSHQLSCLIFGVREGSIFYYEKLLLNQVETRLEQLDWSMDLWESKFPHGSILDSNQVEVLLSSKNTFSYPNSNYYIVQYLKHIDTSWLPKLRWSRPR